MTNAARIDALWIEDNYTDIMAAVSYLESKLPIKFDHAISLSSALRKLKRKSYNFIFIDSIIPLGSEKIIKKEFNFHIENDISIGESIVLNLLQKKILKDIRSEELYGLILCTGLDPSKEISALIDSGDNNLLYVSKDNMTLKQGVSFETMANFLIDKNYAKRVLWGIREHTTDNGDKIQHIEVTGSQLIGPIEPGRNPRRTSREEVHYVAAAAEKGVTVRTAAEVQNYLHDQSQSLRRQIAQLDAVMAELSERRIEGISTVNSAMSFLEVAVREIDTKIAEVMDRSLGSVKLHIMESIDEKLMMLRV